MFDQTTGAIITRQSQSAFRALLIVLSMLLGLAAPALAQASNPSGLPLPRFASTRSDPINVRVGPGTKYDIAWTYVKSGLPVEIVQEFDTWRKIRDVDGTEGWVHQNLLSGTRMGFVTPVLANAEIPLRANRSDESSVRARLGPGLKVTIKQCDGEWCEVSATGGEAGQRSATYSGFLHQEELWGVYPQEEFD
ncbi:SH3 domain-containing protein [Devosia sp. RR2S18]|uniref:SH3 domain-containing protein n=1 Tax=Devosia rhizosphaerae TaxID=3049774 RepID=UPI002540A799|nr:SH3 domain-containing protein [Devosia sp. RR2S18]WIJ25182.1 SH3 domain-containing protein [Devosia sp. RR2S18]